MKQFQSNNHYIKTTNHNQQMTQVQNQIQINSERKMGDLPVIGTQILDNNMPSELNFGPKKKSSFMNPEQLSISSQIKNGTLVMKQFNIRGKGIFEMATKYKQNDVVPVKDRKYPVKAMNEQGSKGLINIWQSVVGYSKKQLIIQDGQIYLTNYNPKTSKNILQTSYKLTSLMKIFVDVEQKNIRLVFRCQNNNSKRIFKDYRSQDIGALMEKILLECSVVGLEVIPDDC